MQPQHEILFVEGLLMQRAQGSLARHQRYKALCAAVGSKFTFSGCIPPSSTVSLKSCKSFAAEIKTKNIGPAAGLMSTGVLGDAYESLSERKHNRVEAGAVHTQRWRWLPVHPASLRLASN